MDFGITEAVLPWVMGGLGIGAGVMQAKGARDALKAQRDAQDASVQSANDAVDKAQKASQQRQAKAPNVGQLYAANADAAKGGLSSTQLTGAQGVDPSAMLLGKQTLLGL